jgi:hypothetical protein
MTIGGFEIERKFNLGHLATILTVIVGLSMGWQALAGTTAENTGQIASLRAVNAEQDKAIQSLLAVINADRLEQQKLLTEMRTDIRYLRRDVEAKKRAEDAE